MSGISSVLVPPKSSVSLSFILYVKPVCLPLSDVGIHPSPPQPPVQYQRESH